MRAASELTAGASLAVAGVERTTQAGGGRAIAIEFTAIAALAVFSIDGDAKPFELRASAVVPAGVRLLAVRVSSGHAAQRLVPVAESQRVAYLGAVGVLPAAVDIPGFVVAFSRLGAGSRASASQRGRAAATVVVAASSGFATLLLTRCVCDMWRSRRFRMVRFSR